MKMRISSLSLMISLGVSALLPQALSAQEASVTVSAPPVNVAPAPPPAAAVDPAKLPYGVADVVKLARAQVSEDVITTYLMNSGTAYNLSPNEIVYLRDQGVSDHVINIMLDQRRNVAASVNQVPAAPAAQQPAYPDNGAAGSYAQTAPNAPSSSLYVIPYSTSYPGYSYYDSYPYYPYPYYGGYYGYGYYGPSFVFGFGHSHGYHGGGYHGGGYHGGGYHGGGGIHVGHGGGGSGHSGHH